MLLDFLKDLTRTSMMSNTRRPRFRIHRLDSPAVSHYQAFWQIEGNTFRVQVWDEDTWRQMPEAEHPPDALPLSGPGWMQSRPIAALPTRARTRFARR